MPTIPVCRAQASGCLDRAQHGSLLLVFGLIGLFGAVVTPMARAEPLSAWTGPVPPTFTLDAIDTCAIASMPRFGRGPARNHEEYDRPVQHECRGQRRDAPGSCDGLVAVEKHGKPDWLAYNDAHDIVLPGSKGPAVPFLMYPQAETAAGRLDPLDPLDPEAFKYTITAREVPA